MGECCTESFFLFNFVFTCISHVTLRTAPNMNKIITFSSFSAGNGGLRSTNV